MKKIRYADMPEPVRSAVAASDYLYGYAVPERGRYVVRSVDRSSDPAHRRAREREFDGLAGRWLSAEERLREHAASRRELPEYGLLALVSHRIDPDTQGLLARIEIRDDRDRLLTRTEADVYPPIPEPIDEVIAAAAREASFPAVYAGWSRDERIGYWAALIHRYRRAHGEGGHDENEIFTPQLVLDCERLEPRFCELLPDVLALLGRMEQTPAQEMVRAFRERVGHV